MSGDVFEMVKMTDFRARTPKYVRTAMSGKEVVISKHGAAVAVVVGAKQWRKMKKSAEWGDEESAAAYMERVRADANLTSDIQAWAGGQLERIGHGDADTHDEVLRGYLSELYFTIRDSHQGEEIERRWAMIALSVTNCRAIEGDTTRYPSKDVDPIHAWAVAHIWNRIRIILGMVR